MRLARVAVAAAVGALTGFWSTGCEELPLKPQGEGHGPVRFDQLAVGQRSQYLFFDCDGYGNPEQATRTDRPDTLWLAVAGQDGERFRIEESLAPGSESRHGATNVSDPDTTYVYWLQATPESLFVTKPPGTPFYAGSRVFSAATQRLTLVPYTDPATRFIGWQPDLPYHEDLVTAAVPGHGQFGRGFDRLNLLQDNRAMQLDGPGFVFAYSGPYGLARWAYYSWWTRSGHGWDLLPESP